MPCYTLIWHLSLSLYIYIIYALWLLSSLLLLDADAVHAVDLEVGGIGQRGRQGVQEPPRGVHTVISTIITTIITTIIFVIIWLICLLCYVYPLGLSIGMIDTVSFQNVKSVFAAYTLAIWSLRQYGQISSLFVFRIWDAQFEIMRSEIMKTGRMILCWYQRQ